MSLFARTSADAAAARVALKELSESASGSPAERKARLDALRASLGTIRTATDKFVANADAGEKDPNKRLYGKGMVAKIRALKEEIDSLVADTDAVAGQIEEDFVSFETNRLRLEKEEAERLEKEKAEAEAARLEAERAEAARKEAERAAEAVRVAREKAENERIAKEEAEAAALTKLAAEKEAAERAVAKAREEKAAAERAAKEQAAAAAACKGSADASTLAITVKTSKGKSLPMDGLRPDMSVGDLKRAIEVKHGIPAGAQRLIFQGRLLDDGANLCDRKIVAGVVVHLVENAAHRAAVAGPAPGLPKPIVPPGTLCHLANGRTELSAILASCGNQRLAVLDFTAPWCPPCRAIAPVFERLANRFADVTFVKVDTEHTPANAQLAQEMGIGAYPTFQYWIANNKVHEFSGANASMIESGIRKYTSQAQANAASSSTPVASAASSSGSANPASGGLTSRVMAALGSLRSHVSNDDFVVAVRTLLTFVRNVTDNPSDPKYRRVRTGNQAYQSRVARHGSFGTECMRAFGFESVTENGEHFLVLSEAAANNPELRVVKTQLEAAMQAAGVATGAPPAGPQAPSAPTTGTAVGGGGMAGMGGLPGMPGAPGMPGGLPPGLDPAMAAELMGDPAFLQLAQEFATNPELMQFTMRAQAAMQSGDPAAMMAIASDPALGRVQQLMMQNPALMQRMMGVGGGGGGMGMPGLAQMMGGMGGFGGTGMPGTGTGPQGAAPTPSGQPTGTATTPAAQPPQQATQPPAHIPGAPTTPEEEERLLQEAIRLSMEEANKKNQDKSSEEDRGPGGAS